MKAADARAALTQASVNESASKPAVLAILALSVVAGIGQGSWILGILAFVALTIMSGLPHVRHWFAALMAVLWAYTGYLLGGLFGEGAGVGVGLIAGLVGFASHSAHGEVLSDVARLRDDAAQAARSPLAQSAMKASGDVDQALRGFRASTQRPRHVARWALGALTGVFALGLLVTLNAHDGARALADQVASDLAALEAEPEATPPRPVEVAPRPATTRADPSPLSATVAWWRTASYESRIRAAESWAGTILGAGRSGSPSRSEVESYAHDLVACVNESIRDVDGVSSMKVAELAALCAVIMAG